MLRRLRSWLRALLHRDAQVSEIDEELRAHLEHDVDARMARGVPRAEAERQARAALGSIAALREETREARGTLWVDQTRQDLRYGARMLRRYPAFSTTAVLTLAFTIGAVATVLTLIDVFYYERWPVPEADRIVELRVTRDQGTREGLAAWEEYRHFRDRVRGIDGLSAAYTTAPLYLSAGTAGGAGAGGEETFEVTGAVVSAGFFPMAGIEPALGRFFGPSEDEVPGRDRVAVISADFWRSRYGASPGALGSTLNVNETDFTIVGVMPAAFRAFDSAPIQVWLPMMSIDVGYRWCPVLEDAQCTVLRMYGRLADGASLQAADAEVATLHPPGWAGAEPGTNSGTAIATVRGRHLSGVDETFLRLMVLVAGALLAVCCANLAGLMISRGRERAAELAVRASLGAARGRLVRQLAVEALVLSTAGGLAGLAVSVVLTGLLQSRFYTIDSSGRPLTYGFDLRPEVVGGTLAVALLAGLVFGLLPALGLLRRAPSLAAASAAARSTAPVHRWLLGLQVASAVALVALAGLLAASAASTGRLDTLDADRVALLRLRPRLVEYGPEQAQRYLHQVIDRLEATPGVESATMVGTGIALLGFRAEVGPVLEGDEAPASLSGYIEVGPRYFQTLGTPVLRGREFTDRDDADAEPVAVVSASLGRALWPDRDPVGQPVRVGDTERTVVGVVADVQMQPRGEPARPYVYVPFWQNPGQVDARLQVRVAGDPAAMLPTLAREIRAVDARVPVTETLTLGWRLAGMFRPQRMSATAVTYAGGLAILLCGLGLYASLAAAVANRRREIGIRQAIGATAAGVVRMIVGEGLRVILAGLAVGLLAAWIGTRTLRHLFYGSAGGDALWIALAGVAVVLVALLACLVPARRAARIEPMTALRVD